MENSKYFDGCYFFLRCSFIATPIINLFLKVFNRSFTVFLSFNASIKKSDCGRTLLTHFSLFKQGPCSKLIVAAYLSHVYFQCIFF